MDKETTVEQIDLWGIFPNNWATFYNSVCGTAK